MHAILASLGTDGDVLPFIGLGAALRARGHRVTVVAAENYADTVAAHWLEFRQLVSSEAMRQLLGTPDFWHPIKTGRPTTRWALGMTEPQVHLLKSIAVESDSVFITNPAIFAAMLAHEATGHRLAHMILQ